MKRTLCHSSVPLSFAFAVYGMRISQKAFNEIVRENVEDFEYPVEEAIQEAIKEAKLQGTEHLSLLTCRV